MSMTHELEETLPELADGYFWKVLTDPSDDAIDDRPEIRVSLRTPSWIFPKSGRVLAEAWFAPEPTHEVGLATTGDAVRRLAARLLRRQDPSVRAVVTQSGEDNTPS